MDTTSELAFGCENFGLSEEEILKRMNGAKKELKLDNLMNRNIFKLSGGEKQRIACGSVSAMLPEVFVLDEPTSNLDADAIENLKNTLRTWKASGRTVVIAEHRIYWLKEICDRVVYMEDGKIVFDIPLEEFRRFSSEKIKTLGLRGLEICEPKLLDKREDVSEKIIFKNYKFSYGKEKVLDLDEISIPKRSIVAVTGHNGAGKSTFVRCMCGLEKKFKGKTVIDGKENNRKEMLKKCYMVMQDVNHQLFCETVEDEIKLGMDEKNEKDVQKVLQEVDLTELSDRHPMSLSGGQKQRVAIASAILADKSILIFDEPTSGLDYRHMVKTAKLFKKLKDRGNTCFIITHDSELIEMCCTHVLHIENGKIEGLHQLENSSL